MEAIRVKDKEWQLAGVHYVRTEAMWQCTTHIRKNTTMM